jgi:hypothetical protein
MSLTYEDLRERFDLMANELEEWHGIPVPLPELPLTLHDRHPMREGYRAYQEAVDGREIEVHVGGPSAFEDGAEEEETIRRVFHSRKAQATIFIYERGGKVFHAKLLDSPDHSMNRLTYWVNTIGASDAWDLDAEHTAREKLRGLITERQWRHYDLTGSFLETSERSRLTYVFRRLRPTIALSPRHKPGGPDRMRCIAVLCMHPIGYYSQSWGGCLVPSDDVIAHLTYMRGDEAGYWGEANQHKAWQPEAGL